MKGVKWLFDVFLSQFMIIEYEKDICSGWYGEWNAYFKCERIWREILK